MNAGLVPSIDQPTTAGLNIPSMLPGEDPMAYAERATGMQTITAEELVRRNYGPQVDAKRSELESALSRFTQGATDFRAQRLVPALAVVGGGGSMLTAFDKMVADFIDWVKKVIKEIVVPLYQDLTIFWPVFAGEGIRWMEIKNAAHAESEFMQSLKTDGTPAQQAHNPNEPDFQQSTSTTTSAETYDWNSDGGRAYRGSIDQQIKAVERIKEIASNAQDAVSTVATWTMFLSIAIIIFVMPALIRALAVALRLLLQFGTLIYGALRAAAWVADQLQGTAIELAVATGWAVIRERLVEQLNWVKRFLGSTIGEIVEYLATVARNFASNAVNLIGTFYAYLYNVLRMGTQLKGYVGNDANRAAFPGGKWWRPCDHQAFTDPVFNGKAYRPVPAHLQGLPQQTRPQPSTIPAPPNIMTGMGPPPPLVTNLPPGQPATALPPSAPTAVSATAVGAGARMSDVEKYQTIIYDLNYIVRHKRFWCNDVVAKWQPVLEKVNAMEIHNRRSVLLTDFLSDYAWILDFVQSRSREGDAVFKDCFCGGLDKSLKIYQNLEDRQRQSIGYLAAQNARINMPVMAGALPAAATTPPPPPPPPPRTPPPRTPPPRTPPRR
jgi:hypothetical protein